MPLPDERPRQSVANLIGRFETQTKRQPSTASPRSSSVASHTTGDSGKEETKEKREWPPKPSSGGERPPPIIPSSSWTRRNAESQSSANPEPLATQAVSINNPSLTPRPNSTSLTSDNANINPQGEQNVSSEATLNPRNSPTAPTPKPLPKASPSKNPTSSKAPLKPQTKPSVKPTPVAQPLKPHHTGPAGTASSTRKPATKPTPTTPARSKTPLRATPSATRPKTPTSIRSKTPSSGLFAPTAASLARARNAEPQPPTPSKKVTLSSTAADRLSKPTAASLSRARTPSAVSSSPARNSVKPAAQGGAARTTAKPRISATSTRSNKGGIPPVPKLGAAAAVASVTAGGVAVASEPEHSFGEEGDEQGYPSDSLDSAANHDREEDETPAESKEEPFDEPNADHIVDDVDNHFESDQERHLEAPDAADIIGTQPVESSPETTSANTLLQQSEVEIEVETPDPDVDASVSSESETLLMSEERIDEVKPRLNSGDDIEDIVNLLESVPISKARPASITSIPDQIHEIPDEE